MFILIFLVGIICLIMLIPFINKNYNTIQDIWILFLEIEPKQILN